MRPFAAYTRMADLDLCCRAINKGNFISLIGFIWCGHNRSLMMRCIVPTREQVQSVEPSALPGKCAS